MTEVKESKQIEALEEKYGKLKRLVIGRVIEMVPDPTDNSKEIEQEIDPGKVLYLRKPNRQEMKYALTKQVRSDGNLDAISPGEVILSKCGQKEISDPEIFTSNKYYFRACIEANEFLQEEAGFF